MRRIFGPERREFTGAWRISYTEEFHDTYPVPNVILAKSRKMRWAGHVMTFIKENTKRGDDLGRIIGGRIILKWL